MLYGKLFYFGSKEIRLMLIIFVLLLQIYDVSIAICIVVSLCCLNICTLCLPSDYHVKYVSEEKIVIMKYYCMVNFLDSIWVNAIWSSKIWVNPYR
jgi:hypothetical protein